MEKPDELYAVKLTPKEMALIALGLTTVVMVRGGAGTPGTLEFCLDSLDLLDKFEPFLKANKDFAARQERMLPMREQLRQKLRKGKTNEPTK